MMGCGPWSLAALTLAITVPIALNINEEVTTPYMDEIFHAPQTQQYCAGHWRSWDPNITTFPGVYVLACGASWASQAVLGEGAALPSMLQPCSLDFLRGTNLLFLAGTIPILWRISQITQPHLRAADRALLALSITLLPTHFFFGFLYYTDVGSTFFVLACVLAALSSRPWLAAVLGAGAIACRQTGAVWLAFGMGLILLQKCGLGLFADQDASAERQEKVPLPHPTRSTASSELSTVSSRMKDPSTLCACARGCGPGLSVVACFAGFVYCNGGVVIGDRSHHAPVVHVMQLLYAAAFVAGVLLPGDAFGMAWRRSGKNEQAFCSTGGLLKAVAEAKSALSWRRILFSATSCMIVVLLIKKTTVVHPFVLSDNRHFVFKLWRLFLRTESRRLCLAPVYLAALWRVRGALQGRPALMQLGGVLCAALALVPTPLLELRYFTVPCALVMLLERRPTKAKLLGRVLAFALCNALVLFIFLHLDFLWPDGSVARFMW